VNKCANPTCGRSYTPGRYGKLQRVCGHERCRKWYRSFAAHTAGVPRGLTAKDWEKIERTLAGWPVEFRALVTLARETGMRKGEILGLSWGDVWDQGKPKRIIALRGQWSDSKGFKDAKTGVGRNVLVSSKGREALAELRRENHAKYLNDTQRMIPMSCAWAWKAWVGCQRLMGIKNPATGRAYRFHDIRHTAAIELVKAGRIDLAQKLLGHKSIATTMKYAERPDEEVLEDIEKTRRGK
jgi:integrase